MRYGNRTLSSTFKYSRSSKPLEDEANVLDAKLANRDLIEIDEFATDGGDLAGLRPNDAGNEIQQRSLTRAAGPCNGHPLSSLHLEAGDVQTKVAFVVAECQVADFDHVVILAI